MELAIIVLVYSAFIFSCSGLETSYTGQKSSHGSCDAKGQRSCPGLCDAKDPDPCNRCNYKILNSPDRAEGFMTYDQPKCDLMSWDRVKYDTWYRFNGSAGTAMPTHCVETMRCGAEAPGWLYGGHPKAAEGISTRSVCFNWLGKCCYYKNEIKVKNCRGFFVYKFRDPPMNFLRYCGNGSRNGTGQVSRYEVCKREAKKERENPCLSGDYITLRGPSRAQGFNRSRRAKCDMDILNVPEAWYRFAGKAGTMMADKCVPVKHCGTNAPGWLRGPHPEDPSEGEVARTVCFHWKNNCCFWKTRVKVRNCGTFFIYYLKQDPMVGCSFRYCGNGEGPTPGPEKPTTQVSTSETKSPTSTSETESPTSTSERELPTSTSETESPTNTTKPPPPSSGVNVVCGKNEMTISIRKTLLKGIDVEHIRLSDVNCRAIENPTGDRFILQTELTKCGTKVRHAKNFVIYKNKVEEIPIENGQIVTRVREVEIPFSCYYSNTGVVSAVGLEVTSKKIIFSRKGFGQFILEMNIFPNSDFVNNYRKEDFPVSVTLRERLFVKVSVDTDDEKLEIMAETCFATPDPDPNKPALKYMFIEDGCTTDETVEYISSDDQRNKKFSLEAFKFLGEHEFVYMHCKVKICNAKDPNSRCAQGCLSDRQKRSLYTEENNDEEYLLAQGPFMRKDEINEETVLQDVEEVHDMNIKAAEKSSPFVIASTMTSVLCMMGMSYMVWYKKSRAHHGYTPVQVKAH